MKTRNKTKTKLNLIQKHESEYWHIPKFLILPLLLIIILGILAYANLQLIDGAVVKETFKSCEGKCEYNLNTHDLINIYPIIGEYILIVLIIISSVALIKGGYNNLKSYNEKGLIGGLICGLICGLIFGLIYGLILGLIYGLISGLIGGLICGVSGEFDDETK